MGILIPGLDETQYKVTIRLRAPGWGLGDGERLAGPREGEVLIHHNLEPDKQGAESLNSEECCLVMNPNSYTRTGVCVNKDVL